MRKNRRKVQKIDTENIARLCYNRVEIFILTLNTAGGFYDSITYL